MTDPTYPTLAERIREAGIVPPVKAVDLNGSFTLIDSDGRRIVVDFFALPDVAHLLAAALNAAGAGDG